MGRPMPMPFQQVERILHRCTGKDTDPEEGYYFLTVVHMSVTRVVRSSAALQALLM
jgi:hypothetical protein